MIRKIGFDTKKYLNAQINKILDRVSLLDKLYLEFGGKLCYDYHASVCFQVLMLTQEDKCFGDWEVKLK